ncbi:MAG: type 4a pilus biogenesis protein PilO [Candidatus Paceibacterota bacterium]
MIRLAIPLILISVALGLFFVYIDPTYQNIKKLSAEEKTYNEALNQSRELQEIRDTLLSRYNTFSQEDLSRLNKLLPDHVDNVRLILDIDSIASNYGMRTRNVTVSGASSEEPNVIGANQNSVDSVILSFSVSATYENFIRFIKDLESSLRIVDVVGLTFSATEGEAFNFNISIRTYWLK